MAGDKTHMEVKFLRRFAVAGALPILPYSTAIDRYILWSFFFLSLTLISLFFVNAENNQKVQVSLSDEVLSCGSWWRASF